MNYTKDQKQAVYDELYNMDQNLQDIGECFDCFMNRLYDVAEEVFGKEESNEYQEPQEHKIT